MGHTNIQGVYIRDVWGYKHKEGHTDVWGVQMYGGMYRRMGSIQIYGGLYRCVGVIQTYGGCMGAYKRTEGT